MILTSCLLGKSEISFNLLPLALGAYSSVSVRLGVSALVNVSSVKQAIVLAMGNNNLVQFFCFEHGRSHCFLVLYPASIVGKSNNLISQSFHIGKLHSPSSDRYRTVGQNIYYSVTFNYIKLFFEMLLAVRHGV